MIFQVGELKTGMDGDVLISITLTPKEGPQIQFQRTLSDLDRLYQYLVRSYPEYIAPPSPPKSSDYDFLLESVQLFLDRVSSHPIFSESKGIIDFPTNEFQFLLPPSPIQRNPSQKSLFSFEKPAQDTDVYFEESKREMQTVATYITSIGRINERLAIAGRDICKTNQELGQRLLNWGPASPGFVRILKKMAKACYVEEEALFHQVHYRATTLTDQLLMLLRGAESSQSALDHRSFCLESYDQACKHTMKKLQQMDRMRGSSSIKQEKVDLALEELTQSKRVEQEAKEQFKKASDVTRLELERYRQEKSHDLERMMDQYVKSQIAFCKELQSSVSLLL
ncbi:Vps5 C terminal like-domain-containing protein [Gorgonomyces haynaldii]|nr:Vps5 C terminal like-domain-containing protein [Gorgonomyces haynaldii]